jgi:Nidogen-like
MFHSAFVKSEIVPVFWFKEFLKALFLNNLASILKFHYSPFCLIFSNYEYGILLQTNTFQCALVTNGSVSYVIYSHEQLTWTTGYWENGDPDTCLGETSPLVRRNIPSSIFYIKFYCRHRVALIPG